MAEDGLRIVSLFRTLKATVMRRFVSMPFGIEEAVRRKLSEAADGSATHRISSWG
jgi:hypothetical protein